MTAIAVAGCRTPTEITVDVRTDIPCAAPAPWHGIAVYAGSPGLDVETKSPALTTTACDASGHIGSVVLVPSADKNQPIAVRVVAGITRAPEECATHGYEGCVVARRQLSFIPHESLSLSIVLSSDCVSQGCDPLHTCVRGTCSDSRLDAPTPTEDAPSGPTVHCGSDETVRCPVNDVHRACCVAENADGTSSSGACTEASTCKENVFLCDKNSDCAGSVDDLGQPYVCCVRDITKPPLTSGCMPRSYCGSAPMLCSDRAPCLGVTPCEVDVKIPSSYFACFPP